MRGIPDFEPDPPENPEFAERVVEDIRRALKAATRCPPTGFSIVGHGGVFYNVTVRRSGA